MLVRWLGAFGRGGSLRESFAWELEQHDRNVAAEQFHHPKDPQGNIVHAIVGIQIDARAALRTWRGDVWSIVDEQTGYLKATRPANISTRHRETFCRSGYARAIVLKKHPHNVRLTILRDVAWAAKKYNLRVFWLTPDGKKKLVTREVMRFYQD